MTQNPIEYRDGNVYRKNGVVINLNDIINDGTTISLGEPHARAREDILFGIDSNVRENIWHDFLVVSTPSICNKKDFYNSEFFYGVFVNITFISCNFEKCLFKNTSFLRCHFAYCNFDHAVFNMSKIENTTFESCNIDPGILFLIENNLFNEFDQEINS